MKRMVISRFEFIAVLILLFSSSVAAQNAGTPSESDSKLLYADFQNQQNGRPASRRGGMTRLNSYYENPANPPQFRGMDKADPPAPAFARVTAENVGGAFDYEFRIPNEWEGVNLEVCGQPEKDGK